MSSSHFNRLARELEEDDDAKRIAREEHLAELRDIAARKRRKQPPQPLEETDEPE